jgi:hypothetical protein
LFQFAGQANLANESKNDIGRFSKVPITSINGLYNGYIVKYSDEHLQELLSLSNFESQGGVISTRYVYFPNPNQLRNLGIDHSPRPYRVFLLENDLIVPEFFSFDLEKWYSTFYSKIPKDKVKTVILQGIHRTYELIKSGSFMFLPSINQSNQAVQVYFNGNKMAMNNIYPYMKYAVDTQSVGFSDGMEGTINKGVKLGWRFAGKKYDLSVLLFVDALENAISFISILSDIETGKGVPFKDSIDHKENVYHIKSMDR